MMQRILLALFLTFSFARLFAQPLAISTELNELGQVDVKQWDGDGVMWVSFDLPMMVTYTICTLPQKGLFHKWREKRRVKKYYKEEIVFWENGQEPEVTSLEGLEFTPARNAQWGMFPFMLGGFNYYANDSSEKWHSQEYTTQSYNCRGGVYYNTYFYSAHKGKNELVDSVFSGSVYRIDTVSKKDTSSCWEYFYRDQNLLTKIVAGDMSQRSYQPAFNRSILLFEYTTTSQLKRIIGLTDTLDYTSFPLGDSLISQVKKGFYLPDEEESDLIKAIQYQPDGPEVNFLLEYEYNDSLLTGAWYWSKDWSNFMHDSVAYTADRKVSAIFHMSEKYDARGTNFAYNEKGKVASYQHFYAIKENNAWKLESADEAVVLKYIRRKDIPQDEDSNSSSDE
ncbi:MAG: hypothetical protein RLZZ543_1537 [Bacteroidota bacterium]